MLKLCTLSVFDLIDSRSSFFLSLDGKGDAGFFWRVELFGAKIKENEYCQLLISSSSLNNTFINSTAIIQTSINSNINNSYFD